MSTTPRTTSGFGARTRTSAASLQLYTRVQSPRTRNRGAGIPGRRKKDPSLFAAFTMCDFTTTNEEYADQHRAIHDVCGGCGKVLDVKARGSTTRRQRRQEHLDNCVSPPTYTTLADAFQSFTGMTFYECDLTPTCEFTTTKRRHLKEHKENRYFECVRRYSHIFDEPENKNY